MVKGKDILQKSLSLMGESINITSADVSDFATNARFYINILLSELYEVEMLIEGKVPSYSDSVPQISSLEDEITYSERLSLSCMPLGLAFYCLLEEDTDRASFFYRLYHDETESIKNAYKVAVRHKIKNVY